MSTVLSSVNAVEWIGQADGRLRLIDQTKLPGSLTYIECHDVEQLWEAIKSLRVRGAPAIGIAAAYGVSLGAASASDGSLAETSAAALSAIDRLATSRPTAVNLFWALERLRRMRVRN